MISVWCGVIRMLLLSWYVISEHQNGNRLILLVCWCAFLCAGTVKAPRISNYCSRIHSLLVRIIWGQSDHCWKLTNTIMMLLWIGVIIVHGALETGGQTEGTPRCLRERDDGEVSCGWPCVGEPSPCQLGGDIGAGQGQRTRGTYFQYLYLYIDVAHYNSLQILHTLHISCALKS